MAVCELRGGFHTDIGVNAALSGGSLSADSSESIGIVGTTGSGKSVLARAIMGLIGTPGYIAGGSIRFAGTELIGLQEQEFRTLRAHDFGFIVSNPRTRLDH